MQLGLKIVNPRHNVEHPVSLRIMDSPGSIKLLNRAAQFAFQKTDIVLILHDASKPLDEDLVRDWTTFTLGKIYQYHRASTILKVLNMNHTEVQNDTDQRNPLASDRGHHLGPAADVQSNQLSFQDQHQATFGVTQNYRGDNQSLEKTVSEKNMLEDDISH